MGDMVVLHYWYIFCLMEERFETLEEAVEEATTIEMKGDGSFEKIVTPEREYSTEEGWTLIRACQQKRDRAIEDQY